MNDVIKQVKAGNQRVIERLYNQYKSGFLRFLSRYNLTEEEVLDLYQDAFVVFLDNAERGKLDALQAEVRTYLYAVGKYKALRLLRQKVEYTQIDEVFDWQEEESSNDVDPERVMQIERALSKLGKRCYDILYLFYYASKKLEEIQVLLGYEKKDVIKSQKSRCLRQLRTLIEDENQ